MKSAQQHFLDIVHGTGEILSYVLSIPKWALIAFISILALVVGIVTLLTIGLILGLSEAQNGLRGGRDAQCES